MSIKCTIEHTVEWNVAAIKEWHERSHFAESWAECRHEPCNVTTPDFRRVWS